MEVLMSWRKTLPLLAVVLLSTVVLFGCKKPPTVPVLTVAPETTYVGMPTVFKATATGSGDIRYVFDFGDAFDSTEAVASGAEASLSHVWTTVGTVTVRAKALLASDLGKESDWCDPETVHVLANDAPILDSAKGPSSGYASIESDVLIRAWAHDPNGDSIRFFVQWKSSRTDSSPTFLASPALDSFYYAYDNPDTVTIIVTARDHKYGLSAAESVEVVIGPAGGVVWYWLNEENGTLTTSALLVWDGEDTVVCSGCEDDNYFYSFTLDQRRLADHKDREKAQYTSADDDYPFVGHPAYCQTRDHILVSSEEGEIYAIRPASLAKQWRWPDSTYETLTDDPFGPPAINGAYIYVASEGTTNLYRLVDESDNKPTVIDIYDVHAEIMDAPIIDASGNVIFGTDSGRLVCLNGAINTEVWRSQVQANGEIYAPALGAGGVIYACSDQDKLYAINPTTHTPDWTFTLDGTGRQPAVGTSAVFVGTDRSKIYAINLNGGQIWVKTLTDQITTTPIIVTGGYLYVQSDDDKLWCLDQSTGATIWVCDCAAVLPEGWMPQHTSNYDITPNPTVTGSGNIIVIGERAAYCVEGYPEKTLDATAPWPKWQRNVHNSGK
jgi:outer membrane protein assembly factor BamB